MSNLQLKQLYCLSTALHFHNHPVRSGFCSSMPSELSLENFSTLFNFIATKRLIVSLLNLQHQRRQPRLLSLTLKALHSLIQPALISFLFTIHFLLWSNLISFNTCHAVSQMWDFWCISSFYLENSSRHSHFHKLTIFYGIVQLSCSPMSCFTPLNVQNFLFDLL